jgi:8-oxo-dGTP pyrophosphatase MutT (NUDIX family)
MLNTGREELPVLVAAGVVVRRGTQVLLQQRGGDGLWGLPGGALNPGETLEAAARRELLEETGLSAGTLTLRDVYSGPEFVVSYPDGFSAFVVGATYETWEVTGSAAADGTEGVALKWFNEDDTTVLVNPYNQRLLARIGLVMGPNQGA